MKKISIISGIFPPDVGGPATFLHQLTLTLNRKGYSLNVITYGEEEGRFKYPFPVKRISRKKPEIIKLLVFVFYVLKYSFKSELLFVSDYGIPALVANLFLKKKMVIRIVEDFAWEYAIRHGLTTDLIDEFQEKKYSLKIELLKQIRNMYIRSADAVIVPSLYLKKKVSDLGIDEKKIHVLYNAIELSNLDLSSTKEEIRKRLNLDGKTLLSVARLVPWKGIDTCIEALTELDEEIKLLVIGDGFDLPRLQKLVRDNNLAGRVKFLGFLDHGLTFLYMRAADIFILDSGYEGLSHVILEAMLAEVPIIASNKGGNPELISDGENGFLVPYQNPKALEEAINKILRDEQLTKKFVLKSKEKVKNFNWEKLVEQVIQIIK